MVDASTLNKQALEWVTKSVPANARPFVLERARGRKAEKVSDASVQRRFHESAQLVAYELFSRCGSGGRSSGRSSGRSGDMGRSHTTLVAALDSLAFRIHRELGRSVQSSVIGRTNVIVPFRFSIALSPAINELRLAYSRLLAYEMFKSHIVDVSRRDGRFRLVYSSAAAAHVNQRMQPQLQRLLREYNAAGAAAAAAAAEAEAADATWPQVASKVVTYAARSVDALADVMFKYILYAFF
jgi:hypothetical protein